MNPNVRYKGLEVEMEISRSPQRVWEFLAQAANWAKWAFPVLGVEPGWQEGAKLIRENQSDRCRIASVVPGQRLQIEDYTVLSWGEEKTVSLSTFDLASIQGGSATLLTWRTELGVSCSYTPEQFAGNRERLLAKLRALKGCVENLQP